MSRTVTTALLIAGSLALLLVLLIGYGMNHTPAAAAQSAGTYDQHAGVVISFGNGAVLTRCVDLGEDRTANAIEVLESARPTLTLAIEAYASSTQVCKIEATGCPTDNCLCDCAVGIPQACQAYNTWRRYTLDEGAWQTPTTELQRATVRAGDVEGWAWGTHTISQITPPVLAFDEVCVSAILTPTSTLPPTPTSTPPPTNTVPTDTAPTDTPAPTASVKPSVRPTIDRRQEAPAPADQPVENPPTAAPPTPTITPRPIQPTRTPLPSNTPLTVVLPTDPPVATSAPVQVQPTPPIALPVAPSNLPSSTSVPTAPPTEPPPLPTEPPPTASPSPTPNLLETELALPSPMPITDFPEQGGQTPLPATAVSATLPPATATPVPDVAGVPSGGELAESPARPQTGITGEQNTSSSGSWLLYISIGLMLVLFLLLLLTLQIRAMRQRE